LKGLFAMMCLLIGNVFYNHFNLRVCVGESAISTLPIEFFGAKTASFDKVIAVGFDVLYQLWNGLARIVPDENVYVVWHAIDNHHLMSMILNNSGDVSIQIVFPGRVDQTRASFDSKD
jgi:hypothetical protein